MAITGIGSGIAATVQAQTQMQNQLDTLSRQLGTGQKAAVYSDLGLQAGITVGLDAQLSAINVYNDTATSVGTTLTLAQNALSQMATVGNTVQEAATQSSAFALNGNGQTSTQASAATQLDQILSMLNTQSGNNYMFSGSAVNQPSVDTTTHILNGNGAQAGLTQIILERYQADFGSGSGRLLIPAVPPAGTTVSISEDVFGSPFGFKLAGVNSGLTGAVVTGPTVGSPGNPSSISVNLASNPNDGDTIAFSLTLPDGTQQTISLQAISSATPGPNQFSIGATPDLTAANLQAALSTAVGNLAQTTLPAASAVAAADNFFNSDPPLRVAGPPPLSGSTSLVAGTPANTVFWYTGENGATPARQTQLAGVGPNLSIAYGMRANEPAIATLVANVAVLAATSYSPSNPNASASYSALAQRVATNLAGQQGAQSIDDIEADLANAQVSLKNAQSENQQTQSTLTEMLQGIDGVSQSQIGAQILAIQNSLQASYSTSVRLAQLSIVNYLGATTG
jgi:flagellin-like hook-associated protein FlgL